MNLGDFRSWIDGVPFGKRLPAALYIIRPADWSVIPPELAAIIERAGKAARPGHEWNLLKLHTDQAAITFLSYPRFDEDPHPALAAATKINLNTGSVVRADYSTRANPPILHRKETFLPKGDPRIAAFAALTAEEEAEGLYRDPSKIGLRIHWQTLLKRKGLSYDGHRLIREEPPPTAGALPSEASVERHRTAIKRYDLSKPVKMALERGLISKSSTVFDYGCGHGMDIEGLASLGYTAAGWDPAFRPDSAKVEADAVNLGYVLNVIENPHERIEALRAAFALARNVLIVSTLVTGQETGAHVRPLGDGFLTKSNTFQKFYTPGELESLIEETLGVEALTLSLGICVVFKNPADAEAFDPSSTV